MPHYYVHIETKGKVVFSHTISADTRAQAFDRSWDAFDPEGTIDMLDTSHEAYIKEVERPITDREHPSPPQRSLEAACPLSRHLGRSRHPARTQEQ